MDGGGLCVMTPGLQQVLVLLVVNLDFLLPVPAGPQVALEGEVFVVCRRYRVAMGTIMFFGAIQCGVEWDATVISCTAMAQRLE